MLRPVLFLLVIVVFACALFAGAGCSKEPDSPEPTAASQVPGKVAAPSDGKVQSKPKMALPPP